MLASYATSNEATLWLSLQISGKAIPPMRQTPCELANVSGNDASLSKQTIASSQGVCLMEPPAFPEADQATVSHYAYK